eukprot:Nitzschia sp. Nitz4//scaffold320_size20398//5426//9476//NITZ4_008676-RA/size20398-processed-gene-0.11-mRNA-1//-1//CDS//3329547753//3247//frame0
MSFLSSGDTPLSQTRSTNDEPPLLWPELQERTNSFLDPKAALEVGDESVWMEASQLIHGWLQYTGKPYLAPLQKVQNALNILDRLASILPQGEILFASALDTAILNQVLLVWKRGVSNVGADSATQSLKSHLTPSFLSDKIDRYRWCSLVQPDCISFNLLLSGSIQFPPRDGVQFADAMLEKIIQLTEDERIPSRVPLLDIISVGTVIHAWVQHGNLPKAIQWLERLRMWSSPSSSPKCHPYLRELRPNNVIFSTLIAGYAKDIGGDSQRALDLLKDQLEYFQSTGDDAVRPDTQTFNTVLEALANSRHPSSAAKAEEVFKQMKTYTQTLGWNCYPDAYTYAVFVKCHANKSIRKAEKVLQRLEREHSYARSGADNVFLVAYNSILQKYASQHGLSEACLRLLQEMEDSDTVEPDIVSYNTALSSLAKPTKAEAKKIPSEHDLSFYGPHEAESLLYHMRDNTRVVPNALSYAHLIQCWTRYYHDPESATRAAYWLQEMEHGRTCQPDIACYNTVLTAYCQRAQIFRDLSALEQAVQLLASLLTQTNRGDPSSHRPVIQPTAATFQILLRGVAGSTATDKANRIGALVKLMRRSGFEPSKDDWKLIQRISSQDVMSCVYKVTNQGLMVLPVSGRESVPGQAPQILATSIQTPMLTQAHILASKSASKDPTLCLYRKGFFEHFKFRNFVTSTMRVVMQQGTLIMANFLTDQMENDNKRNELVEEGMLTEAEAEEQGEEWEKEEWEKRWKAFPSKLGVAFAKYHCITLFMRSYEAIIDFWYDERVLDKLTMDPFFAALKYKEGDKKNTSSSTIAKDMFHTTFWGYMIAFLADYSVHQLILLYGYYVYVRRKQDKLFKDGKEESLTEVLDGAILSSFLKKSTQLVVSRGFGLVCSSMGAAVGTLYWPGWGTLMFSNMGEGFATMIMDDGQTSSSSSSVTKTD